MIIVLLAETGLVPVKGFGIYPFQVKYLGIFLHASSAESVLVCFFPHVTANALSAGLWGSLALPRFAHESPDSPPLSQC